jgi:integrase
MPDFKQQRVNGKFYVVWYEDGKRQRRSLGTSDSQEAACALTEFKRAFDIATTGTPTDMTTIYQAYVDDRQSEAKPAVPRIKDAWKHLCHVFGAVAPSQITEGVCRAYARDRKATGASDGTTHVELGYLRAAVRFAMRRKWITVEPYIPLPRKPEPKDHHLTKDEARLLLASAIMPHVKLFIVLALATAGRAGAILDLSWNRIDFERRRIYLRDPDKIVTIKGRAVTPMNQMAYDALSEAKAAALTPFVIEWACHKVASVKKAVARASARAGLVCTPHVLRHTAAVWMAEAGVPMEQISQYLGHTNTETTRRVYARFSPDFLQSAAAALDLGKDTGDIGHHQTLNRERVANKSPQITRKTKQA